MKKKQFFAILLALCMGLSLIGCGGGSGSTADSGDAGSESTSEGRMLVAGINYGLDSFDPQYSWNMFCTRQVYDTLLSINENGELAGNLATEWSVSDDGLVYTFQLREDAVFSNGEPLTAEDCVYTFERANGSSFVDAAFTSQGIASVEAPDAYTFVITLTAPNPAFLGALTNVAASAPYGGIVSKAVAEEYGDQFGLSQESVVGSGPYKLVEWVVGEYAVFETNEYYWGEKPAVEKAKLVMMQETSSALIALESGDMDIYLSDLATTDVPLVEANDSLQLETYAASRFYYFVLNSADGPCANPVLRQAIQLAVDREKLNLLVTSGYGEIVDQLGGTNFTANPNQDIWPDRDPETAKKLVEENGLTGTTVTLKCSNSGVYPDMMTALQQDLEEIGLVCDIQLQERATWVEDVCTNGNFDISVVQWACDPDMDCMYSLLSSSGSGNYGSYSNSEVDALLGEARLYSDASERAAVYAEALEITTEEVPVVPLFTAAAVRAFSADLGYTGEYIHYDCLCYYHWN